MTDWPSLIYRASGRRPLMSAIIPGHYSDRFLKNCEGSLLDRLGLKKYGGRLRLNQVREATDYTVSQIRPQWSNICCNYNNDQIHPFNPEERQLIGTVMAEEFVDQLMKGNYRYISLSHCPILDLPRGLWNRFPRPEVCYQTGSPLVSWWGQRGISF